MRKKPYFYLNRCQTLAFIFFALNFLLLPLKAADITPPTQTVRLLFIHHSTGGNWLADPNSEQPYGGLGLALMANNYFVSATNYSWGPESIGDRTDVPNWPEWFTGPNRSDYMSAIYNETDQNIGDFGSWSRLASNPGGENEIIMFKSCFPNSDVYGTINDDAYSEPNDWEYSIANYKAVYNNLLTYFATRQDKLFVVITAPPMQEGDYLSGDQPVAERAANARAFNNWLLNSWLAAYPHHNVAVFDYYNILTSNGGSADVNDMGSVSGNHHRWWNDTIQHIQTVNNNFAAYPSGDSHPSSAGHIKATIEFVPLLNYFYNQWKSATLIASAPELKASSATISSIAFPNPFNSQITISYRITAESPVSIDIYNSNGEWVRTIFQSLSQSPGTYQSTWDGVSHNHKIRSSGLYFYTIRTKDATRVNKISLIK